MSNVNALTIELLRKYIYLHLEAVGLNESKNKNNALLL